MFVEFEAIGSFLKCLILDPMKAVGLSCTMKLIMVKSWCLVKMMKSLQKSKKNLFHLQIKYSKKINIFRDPITIYTMKESVYEVFTSNNFSLES